MYRNPEKVSSVSDALDSYEWRDQSKGAIGMRAVGVWGATAEKDRAAIAGLPIQDATDQLELGVAGRVRARQSGALRVP